MPEHVLPPDRRLRSLRAAGHRQPRGPAGERPRTPAHSRSRRHPHLPAAGFRPRARRGGPGRGARCRGGARPSGWKRWRRGSGSSPAARRAPTTGSWARTAPAGSPGAALGLTPQGDSVGLGGSLSGLDWRRLVLAFPEIADAYLWIFPRPGGASVGIAYTPGRLTDGAARAALDGFLDAICRRAGGICPGRATAIRSRSSGPGPCGRCAGRSATASC